VVRRWPLPLWPHLYWEVLLSGPGGSVLQEHLVRAPGSPVPRATPGRLRVWETHAGRSTRPASAAASSGACSRWSTGRDHRRVAARHADSGRHSPMITADYAAMRLNFGVPPMTSTLEILTTSPDVGACTIFPPPR
jgi:hypothetical protein